MSLGLLEIALQIGLAIHAYRTGRMFPWFWVILFIPGIGSLLYLILEVAPGLVSGRSAQKARDGVVTVLDPGRTYRALARDVEIAPTVGNKLKLAEECMRLGRTQEASTLYTDCAAGLYATDPAILGGLARARFASGDLDGARAALDTVQRDNPNWRAADVQLLYAQILTAQGHTQEALAALRALAGTYPGEEARFRYAELLRQLGKPQEAQAEYREIVRRVELQGRTYRRAQKPWYEGARKSL